MTALTALREGSQDAHRGLAALTRAGSGLDLLTAELVKVRVSQINGCAYCVDLHVTKAVEGGEDPRRLHALAVWREAPFFDEPLPFLGGQPARRLWRDAARRITPVAS